MNKCHFRSRARLLVTGSVFIALIAVGIYLQPGFCPRLLARRETPVWCRF